MTASPELTGGAGFTYEDAVVAYYLSGVLAGGGLRGMRETVAKQVLVQRAAMGHPLDDLIVEGEDCFGAPARLSLQVKTALVLSGAPTNTDFRDVIHRSWRTFGGTHFRRDRDKLGAVASRIATGSLNDFRRTADWARLSSSASDFFGRLAVPGYASDGQRELVEVLRGLVLEIDATADNEGLWLFLRHLALIHLDVLSEGGGDDDVAIDRVRTLLADDDTGRAPDLWTALQKTARSMAGAAGSIDRSGLLRLLQGQFAFAPNARYARDLAKIAEETAHSLSDITLDIAGYTVGRDGLLTTAEELLASHRLLHVVGEAGTGKSAILRLLAEAQRSSGFALVLRPERLVGPGWPALARHLGLGTPTLRDLLTELGASSEPILFIDGLDRVATPEARETVLDLVRTILGSPTLQRWRIVATLRDGNIEHVRTWLPEALLLGQAIGTLSVPPLDSKEASELGRAVPRLQPLLFGSAAVRVLSRRPFFLRVLAASTSIDEPTPTTECELLYQWWRRGGYDAAQAFARQRQEVLRTLADRGAHSLGRSISASGVDAHALQSLIDDGLLGEDPVTHRVWFRHDIFFEWSVFFTCRAHGSAWLDTLRSAGEPPALARVVELLSQWALEHAEDWLQQLQSLEVAAVRSQWYRAWLIGPFGSPRFVELSAAVAPAFEDAVRLERLLVWFQAVKTVANPLVISGDIGGDLLDRFQRLQVADALSWPRDTMAWSHLIDWLLARANDIPGPLISDVLDIFAVWLNAFGNAPTRITLSIASVVHQWVVEIEEYNHPADLRRMRRDYPRWAHLSYADGRALEDRLRGVFVRAGSNEPANIEGYIRATAANARVRREAYRSLMPWSPRLASTCSAALVDFCLAELLEPLPSQMAKERHGLSHWSPGSSDWDSPSINGHAAEYHPASPLREPFHSLFTHAPVEALRLTRRMFRHMMEAWRELHRYDWRDRDTPLPLELAFPWGSETFWGDQQVYTWFRGAFAEGVISSALMALEEWAFAEVARGRPVDDVIHDVLTETECVACLGIAVMLGLHSLRVSATTFPLVTSQRLWMYDIRRTVTIENRGMMANEIGALTGRGQEHLAAVRTLNARPVRRQDLRSLAMVFAMSPSTFREECLARIRAFPTALPFEYESETADPVRIAELQRSAEAFAALGDPANYVASPAPDGQGTLVTVANPYASDPANLAVTASLAETERVAGAHMWAVRQLEGTARATDGTVADAISRARAIDTPTLFEEEAENDDFQPFRRAAVASTAAAALATGQLASQDLAWARRIVERAARLPLTDNRPWSQYARDFDHPAKYAAQGLASLIRLYDGSQDEKTALFFLCAYPVPDVASLALREALSCWRTDARFAWIALALGLRLSFVPPLTSESGGGDTGSAPQGAAARAEHEWTHAIAAVDQATRLLADPSLPVGLPRIAVSEHQTADSSPPSTSADASLDDDDDEDEISAGSDTHIRTDILEHVLKAVPFEYIMSSPDCVREFNALITSLLHWTVNKFLPSWTDSRRRSERRRTPSRWMGTLLSWLGQFAPHLPVADFERLYLARMLELPAELRTEFLRPFVGMYVCVAIVDPPNVAPGAIEVLVRCLDGALADPRWREASRDPSDSLDSNLRELSRALLMVNWDSPAGGATRFANGNWSEVALLSPFSTRLLQRAGDVPDIFSAYLSLVERAFEFYPIRTFLDHLAVLPGSVWQTRTAWSQNTNAARLASLTQLFAERQGRLSETDRHDILVLLDHLVDVGDRRSAALQVSALLSRSAEVVAIA